MISADSSGIIIGDVLKQSEKALIKTSHSPRLDVELLLAYVLGKPRQFLYAHPEHILQNELLFEYRALLERCMRGEPIAYITGTQEFWSLSLNVSSSVLIPRPETELIVELALSLIQDSTPCRVLDLGAGSGAIALAIAHERPDCSLTATDNSPAAISVAEQNALQLDKKNINFLCGDWFAPVKEMRFDIIVSNPPYVTENDPLLERSVADYEPKSALISGANGLDDIHKIINGAGNHLHKNGHLILEHGHAQGAEVRRLLARQGFHGIQTHEDLAHMERCTYGMWAG